jgi:hypothetical protein
MRCRAEDLKLCDVNKKWPDWPLLSASSTLRPDAALFVPMHGGPGSLATPPACYNVDERHGVEWATYRIDEEHQKGQRGDGHGQVWIDPCYFRGSDGADGPQIDAVKWEQKAMQSEDVQARLLACAVEQEALSSGISSDIANCQRCFAHRVIIAQFDDGEYGKCVCPLVWCKTCHFLGATCQCRAMDAITFICNECGHDGVDVRQNWMSDSDGICFACHKYMAYEHKSACDGRNCSSERLGGDQPFFHTSCLVTVEHAAYDEGALLCANCVRDERQPMTEQDSSASSSIISDDVNETWNLEELQRWLEETTRQALQCDNVRQLHNLVHARWEDACCHVQEDFRTPVQDHLDQMIQELSLRWTAAR